jgi:enoyl-CoA hydratase/carnithine racemase
MGSKQALDWGLIEEIADDGAVVEKAMELATAAVQVPAPAMRMVKEAVNATANALHKATAYADADQSQLSSNFRSALDAGNNFNT